MTLTYMLALLGRDELSVFMPGVEGTVPEPGVNVDVSGSNNSLQVTLGLDVTASCDDI